ncbi:DUF2637 domain-containing protein [Micromonospora sp. CPCC 206061]|uniref:DUF2637 domain-containing protein n=1 Tax=Micromonospora sp. CPCC 206061 TaxID=3122410 RepID=UPI002FF057C3
MNVQRVESVVLVLILLIVGGLAGAASFTHVHDWTMHNSPAGTGDWFGWANAAISELIPIAALLTIRRRRRSGGSVGYPLFLLVAAVALSLAAQLAVAKPGLSGWLLSSVPALAFLGLSKLVLTVPAPSSVQDDARTAQDEDRPDLVPVQVSVQDEQNDDQGAVTVDLIQTARRHAAEHRAATGRPITRDELRAALRVASGTASELLRLIRETDSASPGSARRELVPVTPFPARNGTTPTTTGGDQ